jgi:hypothetical protein
VASLHIRNIGANTQVAQRAVLRNRLALQQRTEIVKRIAARVVVVVISPTKDAERKQSGRAKQVRPGGSQVERLDLRALIAGSQGIAVGRIHEDCIRGIAIDPKPWRAEMKLRVERIGILKPGTRVARIEVDGVCLARLIIHAVKNVLLVSLVVHHIRLRRIKKSACLQTTGGDEIAPLLTTERYVETRRRRAKTSIRRAHTARRCRLT